VVVRIRGITEIALSLRVSALYDEVMLLGRDPELALIGVLLEAARRGSSGTLVLRGEPGIGKSALLGYARENAGEMLVLSARGVESEAELPFGGVSQLVSPALEHLEGIPETQRAALKSALGRGPPAAIDRFSAYAAVLSLLAAVAERAALLALVDDFHWLDRSSAEALTFAARRLHEEGVVLLFAAREGGSGVFEARGLPEHHVSGLDPRACAELIRGRSRRVVPPAVAALLQRETGGNPLALVELTDLLSESQLRGHDPIETPLPVGPEMEHAMRSRIAVLPRETQRALVLAAASSSDALDQLAAALRAVGLDVNDLEPAEQAGHVTIAAGRLSFRHPLLRSAAYHGASPRERRAAHAALASVLRSKSSLARRAWHLAAAAVAPEEHVAAELERAAIEARGRASPAAASSALKAAAALTTDPEDRARRLWEAAADAHLSGSLDEARRLLDEGLGLAPAPLLRAELMHARGRVEMLGGSPKKSRDTLLAGADAVEPVSPAKAALMLSDASLTAAMGAEASEATILARRAYDLGKQVGGPVELICGFAFGNSLVFEGQRRAGLALMLPAESLIEQMPAADGLHFGTWFGHCCCIAGDELKGMEVLRRVVMRARAGSAAGALPLALGFLCNAEFRRGNWVESYADGMESVQLAEDTDQINELTNSLVWLAHVEAGLGREAECRGHVHRALELVDVTGADSMRHLGRAALGLLELGLGHLAEAIDHLEFVESFAATRGLEDPSVARATANLVEAYVRARRLDEAASALRVLEPQATKTEGDWALATAARCRGLLADDGDFEACFQESLAIHDGFRAPFERARTELCFGERLRRARRRTDARPWLRRALNTFSSLGAAPWEEWAGNELGATGERARRRDQSATEQLTPQELQVALVVADGATNREAAGALFVSPKTIETHLGHAYRKLGVRSRTELARHLRQRAGTASTEDVLLADGPPAASASEEQP
jgi:DNA-binding CsgD family transcriptional regulator